MTVREYRKIHPHCKYCNHYIDFRHCLAKKMCVWFNMAKKCPMYFATTVLTEIESDTK